MLVVVKEINKKQFVVSKLQDDGEIEQAVELAKAILSHNSRTIKHTLVYIRTGTETPLLIRKLSLNWRGQVIVK